MLCPPRNRGCIRATVITAATISPRFVRSILNSGNSHAYTRREQSVDFANPLAVKALNKALLAHFYAVANWDIPDGFLCPPVPGRADYIHHLADLLAEASGTIPANASILDIGVGANCIYPLIGVHEYGWRFTGSETSSQALSSAQAIISANPGLNRAIRLRRQKRVGRFLMASSIKTSNTTRPCVTRHSTIPPLRHGQVVNVNAVTRAEQRQCTELWWSATGVVV